jgi:hypothetical protein
MEGDREWERLGRDGGKEVGSGLVSESTRLHRGVIGKPERERGAEMETDRRGSGMEEKEGRWRESE